MSASQKISKKIGNPNESKITGHEQQILDTSSIGVLITRISDGTILYANKAIAALLGIPDITPVIGSPVPNFYWDAEERLSVIQRFRTEGSISDYPLRARRADDSMTWVSISIQPFTYEGEQVLLTEIADISERKQAEEALRQTQSLYQSLVEVSPMSICRKDLAGRFTFANQRFLELSQITLADLVGKTDFDLHPSELADKYRRDDLAVMESGQVEEFVEERMVHEGENAYVETIKTPTYDGDGKVNGIQISFWDITDRKQAEKAQKESEERFRSLYNNATIGLYRTTPGGQILMINPTGLHLLGFDSFEELAKRNLEEAGFEEENARKNFREKIESEGMVEQESVWTKKDGTPIFVRESSTLSRDENGNILYYDGSFEDITAHKQAEEALRTSEERFKRFTEATIEGLVFHEQGKIIDVNPAAVAIFGLTNIEELIGRNLLEFIVPEYHQTVLKQMQLESVAPYEVRGIRKDGSTVAVETSTRAYHDGERVIRASSIRDITERKQAEAELRQNELLLSNAIGIARMGYWDLDINTQMFIFNDQYYRTFHATTTEEMGGNQMSVMDFIQRFVPPEEGNVIGSGMQEAIETKDPNFQVKLEAQNLTVQGEVRWVAVWLTIEKDAQGRTTIIHGVNQDITERKRLEAQVQQAFERRGYQVQVSTEISQEVASATQLSDIFERVVTLTKERLGYYHAQLLRYDTAQDAVVLINGYGEIGQKMLAGGHKMPMGQGLIGTAAASGETVLRPILADDPDWRPNPLLPDTQGEIAVPIKWQNTVLGVLDVQSNQAGALSDDDRLLFEGLCGQIAIAMHNAELVETVRQNEARLAEALKTARLANWEYDVEKDIFTFNDQFYSIFHTNVKQHGGYQLSSAYYAQHFVYPEDLPIVGVEIGQALNSTGRHYSRNMEHRILYADGGIGHMQVNINVERDENGKITRYYGANQDITERKQAEEALRVNEARLAEALKIARLANWEYDVEKDIFTFNDQFYSLFHTTAEQHGGYQLPSAYYAEHFVYPDDLPIVGVEIGNALNSTGRHYSRNMEHRILYADGGVGHMQVNINVERDENGKITRYYGANQDITERKKEQEAIAERLEEINRLYKAVSHEGWKDYRNTADLPTGFMYDQAGLRPVDKDFSADDSFINVPMKVLGGEVVGTLTIAEDPQNPASGEDRAFLQQVSEQIALALESARLSAQTQSALSQSERLFDASRSLTQAADLQELVKATVETLNIPVVNRAILGTFSYNAAGELENMTDIANWSNGTGSEVAAIGTSYSAKALELLSVFLSDKPLFFNDTFSDERMGTAGMQVAKSLNIRAGAVLPLFLGTRQLGILMLQAEEPHNFTQEETRLFSALAPQISTVLENRRQFERAQQQAQRESTLNIISQKIQSATTVEAVLQIAARELGHALGAPMTIAQLSMKDKK